MYFDATARKPAPMKLKTLTTAFSAFATTAAVALALLCAPAGAQAQVRGEDNLGTVRPSFTEEPTLIAVPAFGTDGSVPLEYETLPRIIRRNLELSGFFKMPEDQGAVNRQNLRDVENRTVNYPAWEAMGVKHYLMANVSSPSPGVLRAYVLLYDIESRQRLIQRNFEGSVEEIRMLAHTISDEVVRFTKFTDGVARTQLLYVTEQVQGIREIAIMDADGFNPRPLTRYNNISTSPAWGANGTEIYYTSYHGNRANIYGRLLGSGQTWTIAAYGGTNHSPAWNEATRRIVMVLSKDGGSELYSADRDGGNLRRITTTEPNEAAPTWSPDGQHVAYSVNEGGGINIYILDRNGQNQRRLTRRGRWNDAPSWSPDGNRIAFVSRVDGRNDIFVIDADGNPDSLRRLTMNQGNNESPSWAPNSRHLAFSSDRTGRWQIYMMLDDGSNQRQLTTSGNNRQPAWGPYPARPNDNANAR